MDLEGHKWNISKKYQRKKIKQILMILTSFYLLKVFINGNNSVRRLFSLCDSDLGWWLAVVNQPHL